MKISVKFSAAVILLLLVSLGAAAWMLMQHQNEMIHDQMRDRAQTILNFGESCREYTRNILSPAIHREFDRPGRKAPLVLEADSATFVVRGTFQSFKKHAPEYSLREAALNPLNLANQADAAETEIIEQFRADPKMPDVRGFRLKGSVEHFYVARPIVVEAKCLVCHDSPDTAPAELVAGYGRNHGFGWKEGEVNSILIVEVPTEDIRAQQAGVRWRFLIVFGALAVLLAVMIPLLFNRLVNRRLVHAGRVMEQVTGTLLEPLEGSAAGSDIAATPIPDSGQFAKSLTPPQTPLPVTTSRRLTEHRMPVDSGDELGILGATFNRMADAVRDSHLDLEARVRRRTKELSRTNSALEQAKQQLEEHARRLTESLEKLRQSEARARAVLGTALDAIVSLDHNGRVVEFNHAAEEMFGYRRDAVLGREIAELIIPPDLREAHRRGLARYLATGESKLIGQRVEVTALHAHGRLFPIDLALTVIAEKPPLFTAIIRDITERKENAQKLARVHTRLQAILDAATQVAIITTDANALITDFNTGAERMLGYRAEETIGKLSPVLFHDTAEMEEYVRDVCSKHGTPIRSFAEVFTEEVLRTGHIEREWTYIRKNGSRLTVHLSVTARYDSDGSMAGYLGIAVDVTEHAQAEEMLRRAKESAESANRAKSDFLANMSHEIRTPMVGIMGMTELALDTALTPEQRDYLQTVKSSADALLSVINDVLDFSKIEAGRLDLETVPFALRDTVADVLKPLGIRASVKGLELALRVAPDVHDNVIGDPVRLRQVLLNLVGNAIKFTERGEVVVEVKRWDAQYTEDAEERSASLSHASSPTSTSYLLFSVRDTGIGIPVDKIAAVFEPFVQADSSTTRKYGGTGLGLTISTRLVEMMGGRVWVESEVGKGSSFQFTIRLALPATAAATQQPVELRNLRALVVDDNATNRRILVEMLAGWEMKATAVASAQAALEELQRAASEHSPYTVMLIDACMPEMDGFDLARTLRRQPHLAPAALMMLSSADRQGDAARCRELGIPLYLTKPVKQSDLLEALRKLLGRAGASPGPDPAHSPTPLARPLHILLAEDNPVNQRLAAGLLEKQGHRVTVVGDGAAAVRAVRDGTFDMVLMDVQMPQMSGLEATAAIRALETGTGRHVPILAMTARAMKGDREECLKAGMDDYLAKPVQSWQLYQAIAALRGSPPPASPQDSAAKTTEPRLFDPQPFLHRLNGDHSLLREMIDIFESSGPELLGQLRSALDAGDAAGIRRATHTLKGSVCNFGAEDVVQILVSMETAGRAGDSTGVRAAFPDLERELERLLADLRRWAEGNPEE